MIVMLLRCELDGGEFSAAATITETPGTSFGGLVNEYDNSCVCFFFSQRQLSQELHTWT